MKSHHLDRRKEVSECSGALSASPQRYDTGTEVGKHKMVNGQYQQLGKIGKPHEVKDNVIRKTHSGIHTNMKHTHDEDDRRGDITVHRRYCPKHTNLHNSREKQCVECGEDNREIRSNEHKQSVTMEQTSSESEDGVRDDIQIAVPEGEECTNVRHHAVMKQTDVKNDNERSDLKDRECEEEESTDGRRNEIMKQTVVKNDDIRYQEDKREEGSTEQRQYDAVGQSGNREDKAEEGTLEQSEDEASDQSKIKNTGYKRLERTVPVAMQYCCTFSDNEHCQCSICSFPPTLQRRQPRTFITLNKSQATDDLNAEMTIQNRGDYKDSLLTMSYALMFSSLTWIARTEQLPVISVEPTDRPPPLFLPVGKISCPPVLT